MKYGCIIYVFLCFNVLHSQNDLAHMMKQYANKDWFCLGKTEGENQFYNYCKPLWFRFNEEELVSNEGNSGEIEKHKIEKILYNKEKNELEIYVLNYGVTLKRTITFLNQHKININYRFFVDSESNKNIGYDYSGLDKTVFNKLKKVKACRSKKIKEIKKEDSLEEPPPPPQ